MDVVNEAASQAVLGRYAGQVLDSGRDLIVMSVGALADSVLLHKLTLPARQRGCRLLLPAGAIGGLDVLAAAALDEI
jgi:aspartate dehydrogenase